jgi:hypothetical protein
MISRRWDACFGQGHLVLRRRRFLPWPRIDVKRIPFTAVLEIRSRSSAEQARCHAQVTVQNLAAPHPVEVFHVVFAAESWPYANSLMRHQPAGPTAPAQPGRAPSRPAVDPSRPAIVVPPQPPAPAGPKITVSRKVSPQPDPSAELLVTPKKVPADSKDRVTTPAVRADDRKRRVWLWIENGKVHGSLTPVGKVEARQLDPAEIARLLLRNPSKAMPAIRALTGIDDYRQALARLHSWHRSDRVVDLSASDLAARQISRASQRPAGRTADGSIRTVSGGLPSLGKRHR